ncbi:Bacteriophage VT1-Sakai, H0018 [uncultured Caudovirales phage]|uniref:Bacteriophage VT1-Sakai, H0018 n=1 Tax=uncultured Caudovirales phage TaxID=2100421 RepID=A0A6J5KLK8_9CAUD|nr:Bacteriophage VT1-Sakai, H0018 [uncultured Caudovirales phage]CAB4123830.1 Bacteriophage VT1-Sakai, H0018 [uncultured Caudovirales phage]
MATDNIGMNLSLVAAADLSAKQFLVVKADSAGKAALAGASDTNQIGIVQNKPTAGQTATIRFAGVSKAAAGGTIAAGGAVTSDSAGKVIAATTGKQIIGTALTGGVSGDVITVLLINRGASA